MIRFFVPGEPHGKLAGEPAVKKVGRRRVSFVRTPSKSRKYMDTVRDALTREGGTIEGPFCLRIQAIFQPPKSALKRAGGIMWMKPDTDNISKAILDGAVKSGQIPDDARCFCELITKRYAKAGEPEGVHVSIMSDDHETFEREFLSWCFDFLRWRAVSKGRKFIFDFVYLLGLQGE